MKMVPGEGMERRHKQHRIHEEGMKCLGTTSVCSCPPSLISTPRDGILCSMMWTSQELQSSTRLKAVAQTKLSVFFACGDSQRHSLPCPFSPSEYLNPSALLNQLEINTHITATAKCFFPLPGKLRLGSKTKAAQGAGEKKQFGWRICALVEATMPRQNRR